MKFPGCGRFSCGHIRGKDVKSDETNDAFNLGSCQIRDNLKPEKWRQVWNSCGPCHLMRHHSRIESENCKSVTLRADFKVHLAARLRMWSCICQKKVRCLKAPATLASKKQCQLNATNALSFLPPCSQTNAFPEAHSTKRSGGRAYGPCHWPQFTAVTSRKLRSDHSWNSLCCACHCNCVALGKPNSSTSCREIQPHVLELCGS